MNHVEKAFKDRVVALAREADLTPEGFDRALDAYVQSSRTNATAVIKAMYADRTDPNNRSAKKGFTDLTDPAAIEIVRCGEDAMARVRTSSQSRVEDSEMVVGGQYRAALARKKVQPPINNESELSEAETRVKTNIFNLTNRLPLDAAFMLKVRQAVAKAQANPQLQRA